MADLAESEAGFLAPARKFGTGEVEPARRLRQQFQRHHQAERVASAVIVDDVLHHDVDPVRRQHPTRRNDTGYMAEL